jgi:predicted transcriptional regulator
MSRNETIQKAQDARRLYELGWSVRNIAKELELSPSRIYQYLRGDSGANWISHERRWVSIE